jgi:hypothetical protein
MLATFLASWSVRSMVGSVKNVKCYLIEHVHFQTGFKLTRLATPSLQNGQSYLLTNQ